MLSGETEPSPFVGPDSLRGGSESRAFDFIDHGVTVMAARFAPTVHGMGDHGFIAEVIGARLGLPVASVAPERAVDHFGFIGQFFGRDMSSSSDLTRAAYGWKPNGPTLAEDIAAGAYDVH